jgi:2-polyprenyl-3-methyl-5-hydroxy-6-metoxy-1,4-benzoquinol methylase
MIKDYEVKQDTYFSDSRLEMLQFIPQDVKSVLDIGCGNGSFGLLCKNTFDCEVYGIELVENAGLLAKEKLDSVLIGDVYECLGILADKSFDLIVLNDVIEHITKPELLLRELVPKLSKEGKI